ncbi:NAD(P)H-binding protein [Ferruginibacter sp. SUN002]|uniref:NAD(P)H-binding protein n=1 Tax=Ferruginibacter sp. SUN002 TaxID=2937789 RepID=UPI003D36067E
MKIILTGATGMVGSEVLRQAIADDRIDHITCIVRKPVAISHTKVTTIIHSDFLKYESLTNVFAEADACIWCLGISQTQVTESEYLIITHDYVFVAAEQMLAANPTISFLFLSGMGADTTEKSKVLFAWAKGQTENALSGVGFQKLYIVRPGAIQAVNGYPNEPFAYKFVSFLFPVIKFLFPSLVITSVDLAKAMLNIVNRESEQQLYVQKELKNWV